MPKTASITLDKWTQLAEKIEVGKNILYYKQSAGLSFDTVKLASFERRALEHSKLFLKSFGKDPRGLFLMSADALGKARTFKFQVKAHNVRSSKIVSNKFKLQSAKVNWGSWRQFTAQSDDSKARKELYDDFIEKSKFLTPLIEARFNGYKRALAEYQIDPLSLYLEVEKIGYERLISFVEELGSALKPTFREALEDYSKEILGGREAEYYDDFYFFRSRVFQSFSSIRERTSDEI